MDWQPTNAEVNQPLPPVSQTAQTGSYKKMGQTTFEKPKPQLKLHCDVCNKDFSGQAAKDSHMAGAKHARAVKSQKIIADLKETGKEIPAATGVNSMFRCATCDIMLNSSQQLSTHLNGSRHKLKEKTTKGGSGGIVLAPRQAFVPASTGALSTAAAATAAAPTASTPAAAATGTAATATATATNGAAAKPQKPAETKPVAQTFECRTCHVSLNSESQRDQHMSSKKHADRMSGVAVSRSRGIGLGFRGRGTPFSTRGGPGAPRGRAMTPRGGRGRGAWIGSGGGYTSSGGGFNSPGGGGYNSPGGGGFGSPGGGGGGGGGGSGSGSGSFGSPGGGNFGAQGGGDFGSQGDFSSASSGQFESPGGGDFASPGGPVFRERGRGQVHSALPYSRPPPPMPPLPPAYQ